MPFQDWNRRERSWSLPVQTELIYRNRGNTSLLEMIGSPPGRVLDCGCGPGDNAAILRRAGWRVTGITIDEAERDAAAGVCEEVVVADLERGVPLAVGGGFDVILMSHVLEHLAKVEKVLSDARERLAPGGVIAVALPNVLHYRPRLRFLGGDFTYTATGVLDHTHLRFYTVKTARELLESNGFDVAEAHFDGGLPWLALRPFIPIRIRQRVDGWALRRWPGLLAWQCLFVARPTVESPR